MLLVKLLQYTREFFLQWNDNVNLVGNITEFSDGIWIFFLHAILMKYANIRSNFPFSFHKKNVICKMILSTNYGHTLLWCAFCSFLSLYHQTSIDLSRKKRKIIVYNKVPATQYVVASSVKSLLPRGFFRFSPSFLQLFCGRDLHSFNPLQYIQVCPVYAFFPCPMQNM